MIRINEDALICDLAETYHVYDYKKLPLATAASLASGLREDSRIKMKLSGMQLSPQMILLAAIFDRIGVLIWTKTKAATKGRNYPKSILEGFKSERREVNSYASGKDFNAARERLLKQERSIKNGD